MQTTIDDKIFLLPCEEFYLTIASNSCLLQNGYQIVYKYLGQSTQNREKTLLHLFSDKVPVLTLVTRTYPVVYADQTIQITAEQKTKTKEYLILEVLLKQLIGNYGKQKFANKKNLGNFLSFLIHFHNNQGFQGWVGFYQKLLEGLITIGSEMIGFILVEILKNSDDRVSCFSKHILSFLINNQPTLKISEEDSLQIIYYCVKSMAFMNGTQDDVLEQYFEPFEQKIIEYIYTSISKSIKIMKYSLKILTVFVADYEIELEKEMISKIKDYSMQLIAQQLSSRLQESSKNQNLDDGDGDDQDENDTTLSLIIYQLIQLFQALLSTEQMKISDYQTYFAVSLASLLLSKNDYLAYNDSTETYLADIDDQGQKSLRNKVIAFLIELVQGDYPVKSKSKLQNELIKYTFILQKKSQNEQSFAQQLINFYANISLPSTIQKQHLCLFQQSLNFLLYHMIEEIFIFDAKNLQQNKQSLMMSLGKNIQSSDLTNNQLMKVSSLNLLNKLIKSMPKGVKEAFYIFLVQRVSKISDFQKQKGFMLSICRGIANVSNEVSVHIVQHNNQKGISISTLQNLIKYLMDANTLQQSAHLILQFLLILLKKSPNAQSILKNVISSQVQIQMLSTFIHDGMIADVVIDLLAQIGSAEFIKYIYGEFMKGQAKQDNLAVLISRWVKLEHLKLGQNELLALVNVYKSQFVHQIVKEFLYLAQRQKISQYLSPFIIDILNTNIHPSWILPMIGCKILKNPEVLLLKTVQALTYQLTSQYEIQNQLLLPYYTFINDTALGVNIIKSQSTKLYEDFINKLIRYATLFQGPNLKVITSHVLLNICEVDPQKIKPVFDLISSYGKTMETDEWEDDHEKDQEAVIDRMFNMKITNDDVEKEFAEIFPNIVFDMALVTSKVDRISALMSQ